MSAIGQKEGVPLEDIYVSLKLHEKKRDREIPVETDTVADEKIFFPEMERKRVSGYKGSTVKPVDQNLKQSYERRPSTYPPPNDAKSFERFRNRHDPKTTMEGKILHVDKNLGVYAGLGSGISGLIKLNKLNMNLDVNNGFKVGKKIKVILLWFNKDKNQVDLGLVERR